MAGKAEVWVDKQLMTTKNDFETADLEVLLPAKEGVREINVLIEAGKDKKAGIEGAVSVNAL